jgi:ataxia telangiectasia mutated family protein
MNDKAIVDAYRYVLKKRHVSEFTDIRGVIFALYRQIYVSHHELVLSYYLQQFALYATIVCDVHRTILEDNPTLFTDLFARAVSLVDFAPPSETNKLLTLLGMKIPSSLDATATGLVTCLENLCKRKGMCDCLERFLARFPDIHNKMMILPDLHSRQLPTRTVSAELRRIADTRRVNEESVNFLLQRLMRSELIEHIDSLSADKKRCFLNAIYDFATAQPDTLGLLLYSQLYKRFFDMHPSPHIISCDIIDTTRLLTAVIECARDDDPSVSRAALTALSLVVTDNKLPLNLPDGLRQELMQYRIWARPTKNRRQPPEDSPWISRTVCAVLAKMTPDLLSVPFNNLASRSPAFAELLFPFAFMDALRNPDLVTLLLKHFEVFAENPEKYQKECRVFLTAFIYLRRDWFAKQREGVASQRWNIEWAHVKLDFHRIASTCLAIGDPYSAFQFAEFARESGHPLSDPELRAIFTHLDVRDLMYGLNTDVSQPAEVALLHENENRRIRALVLYNLTNDNPVMCEALASLHLYNFLDKMKQDNIESLWRLQKWDVSSQFVRDMHSEAAPLFQVMQAFASHNESAVTVKMKEFTEQFRFPRISSVSDQLSQLLTASALQWFQTVMFRHQETKLSTLFVADLQKIYRKNVNDLNHLSHDSFAIAERANALHGVFFCMIQNSDTRIHPNISRFFTDLITTARELHELEAAQYYVSLMRKCERVQQFSDFEQIQLLYKDSPSHAVALLEKTVDSLLLHPGQVGDDSRLQTFNLKVRVTRLAWAAETHSRVTSEIVKPLLLENEIAMTIKAPAIQASVHYTLAHFFHNAHKQLCSEFHSQEFKQINEIIEENERLLSKVDRLDKTFRDIKESTARYRENVRLQREMFSTTITEAIRHYLWTLALTDDHDIEALFSLVGLWFNYSFAKYSEFMQEVPDLIPVMEDVFPLIPCMKFLPLFYQFAARVDSSSDSATQNSTYNACFQQFLQRIVVEICTTAPHHCFPVLYALLHNEQAALSAEARTALESKTSQIRELIAQIGSMNDKLRIHWDQMRELLSFYIKLAKIPVAEKGSILHLESMLGDRSFEKFTESTMPFTSIITTSTVVGIAAFANEVRRLTGVSEPLLFKLKGTDGRFYKQILKGKRDDLRQDSVMQQLFVLSSRLLQRQNRSLSIRSYRVVPLNPTTGVIEFVERTISIQEWHHTMVRGDSSSGFFRYRPPGTMGDETFFSVVKTFTLASKSYHGMAIVSAKPPQSKGSLQALIEEFDRDLKNLQPIFRFFFIERFPNPGDWFVAKMRFCRHAATNSMVGYLFGIGDRHLNNVLIDRYTGELIHIDLGIAFEQGKATPIPELVPFRLTPALIDGMGPHGFEGVFRRVCHQTMNVLRQNSEYLLVILDVLLKDPLSTWSLIPRRAHGEIVVAPHYHAQRSAKSVIISCQRKLEGREMGEVISVEGQVSRLIAEATNNELLAKMFHGWKPYI